MEFLTDVPVPAANLAIALVCYLIGLIIHESKLNNNWIPISCGLFGMILGVLGFLFVPGMPVANLWEAVAMGIVSGLAATGADQVRKQLSTKTESE